MSPWNLSDQKEGPPEDQHSAAAVAAVAAAVSDWGQGTGQCRKLPWLGTQDVPCSAALRALELHLGLHA